MSGKKAVVALIDTGVYAGHNELRGKVRTGRNFSGKGLSTDTSDSSGHGTHIASVICGNTCGIATMCEILPVKISLPGLSNIIKAIEWTAEQGDITAVCMPISFYSDILKDFNIKLTDLESAILKITGKGIPFFASGGHQSSSSRSVKLRYPAAFESVRSVGVSGMSKRDYIDEYIKVKSRTGAMIFQDKYTEMTGSSVACAIAAANYVIGVGEKI